MGVSTAAVLSDWMLRGQNRRVGRLRRRNDAGVAATFSACSGMGGARW